MKFRYLLLLLLLAAAGCGRSLPAAADPGRARAALETALDAWKAGQNAQAMRDRSPAIYFYDPLAEDGAQLVDYRIVSEQANGQGWVCEVLLTVKDRQGQSVERRGGYNIDTDPALVIVRQT